MLYSMKTNLFIIGFFILAKGFSQEKCTAKFGKISPEDFNLIQYGTYKDENVIIIADVGSTEIEGNTKGGCSLLFENYRRAIVLNKNGYDISNVTIGLYTDGSSEEELVSLKAVTYNLENGKVVETKLDKATVFKDKINKHLVLKKFTFPNVKEGSIIEYQYIVKSDFLFNLQPWEFQGSYPRLWSEYNVSVPQFYYYVTQTQGYLPYYIRDAKERVGDFNVTESRSAYASDRVSFSANITDFRWVMKNVPALKEENYTSTINNHISKISFQLAETRYPLTARRIIRDWPQVCKELLSDEYFGGSLNKDNGWLNDIMKEILNENNDDLQKAKKIFTYVRDNITCTNHSAKYMEHSLKEVLKNKNGNVAEINLLLIAMLRKAKLNADPLILSTRSHGYANPLYPILDQYNYVVTHLSIGDHLYYLDASEPLLGFGRLENKCYNGTARIINEKAEAVSLITDSLVEKKLTSVTVVLDEKENLSGGVQEAPDFYQSYLLRDKYKEKGKDQLINEIKKSFINDVAITNVSIDSLNSYDHPLSLKYDFDIKLEKEDILYINPLFGSAYKENPFKSAERFYPVEMPYQIDETYLLQFEVPNGYKTDELPQPIAVKLNENGDGVFEYRLSESNGIISLISRIQLKRSSFLPEEYELLREFFNLIVKKHAEQIVLKKK